MKQDNKLFDDIARLAGNAIGTLSGLKGEIEAIIAQKLEAYFQKMHLVTREEYDVAMEMLSKSRLEQEELKKRIAKLETQGKTNAKHD